MLRLILLAMMMVSLTTAEAIIWQYDNFNDTKKTCRIKRWSGSEPTSGKLTLPGECTDGEHKGYKVTAVATHALDDLKTVTEIVIPAGITQIGFANKKSDVDGGYPNTFYRCPRLKRITVDAANSVFESTSGGMLCTKGLKSVLRVPQKFAASGGVARLSEKTLRLCEMAMAENATIEELCMDAAGRIDNNGGLNLAKNLKSVTLSYLNGEMNMMLHQGAVVLEERELVALLPAGKMTGFSLPETVTTIQPYACYGTSALTTVKLNNVKTISHHAFSGSGIMSVTLDNVAVDESAFENCPRLILVELKGAAITIPDRFAAGSKSLEKVKLAKGAEIKEIGEAAFRGCVKLAGFPLDKTKGILHDSVFYNTGFKEVVVEKGDYKSWGNSRFMFGGCSKLNKINLSAATTDKNNPFRLSTGFAAGCSGLTTLILPEYAATPANKKNAEPAFGSPCSLTRIVGSNLIDRSSQPEFIFASTVSTASPEIFILTPPAKGNSTPAAPEFDASTLAAQTPAGLSPRYFFDGTTPAKGEFGTTAEFFVPGETTSGYASAIGAGSNVGEIFGISFRKPVYGLAIRVTDRKAGGYMIKDLKVTANGQPAEINKDGEYIADILLSSIKKIRLEYTLDGVAMTTDYTDPSLWLSACGIDDIDTDIPDVGASVCIYRIDGTLVASGPEAIQALDNLPSGVYIVREQRGNKTLTRKIIR